MICWWDMESDAGAAQKATCLSVSGVITDENFKTISEFTFRSRLRKSRAFEVDAMLAHNIPLEKIENEPDSNGQLINKLEKKFNELKKQGTTFVGFNSYNYDNLLLSNSLFVNLKWPYITNSNQWDLLPAVRAASAFAPNSLAFQINEKGNRSYKLQAMLAANHIKTLGAHDSLNDARSTRDLASLLFKRAPEVYKASTALKNKNSVFPKIMDGIFCWHEAWRQTKIYCGMTLGQSIFPGWVYLFDLRQDPEKILALAKDTQTLTKSISAPKSYIRTLKSNRAPIIMPAHYSQYESDYRELGMKKIESRYKLLKSHCEELCEKIQVIMRDKYEQKNLDQTEKEPEEMIYSLNTSKIRNDMDAFNLAEDILDKKKIYNKFGEHEHIKQLAKMKIYDDCSEEEFCKFLSKRELDKLKKRIANYLLDTSDKPSPFTKIPEQLARLDTLKLQAESDKDDKKRLQLKSLDDHLVKMMAEYEKYL